jgi:hypothetical protein
MPWAGKDPPQLIAQLFFLLLPKCGYLLEMRIRKPKIELNRCIEGIQIRPNPYDRRSTAA